MDNTLRAVYVQDAKVQASERVKELLPLLEDEPLRLVVQNDLSESADCSTVRDCLKCRYGLEGTEMEWQAKFQTQVQQRGESLVEYIWSVGNQIKTPQGFI